MAMIDRNFTFATNGTVSAADLHNLIDSATIYQDLITGQVPITSVGTNYELLIADGTNPNAAPNAVTVYDLFEDALSVGTYTGLNLTGALTYGTATGTRLVSTNATITTGTITTGVIPNLTVGTTTSTAATITSGTITNLASTTGTIATLNSTTGTIATLNSTTGTIATLNSTTGTITNLSATTSTFLGTITGSTNVINIGSGQIYKDGSGKVLIGTTSNDTGGRLEVKQGSSEIGIGIQSSGTDDSKLFFRTASGAYGGDILFNGSYLKVSNGTTERLRIDSSGNVGINTTTIDTNLHILEKAADANNGLKIQENASASKYYRTLYVDSSGILRFNNGSNEATITLAGSFVNASDSRLKKDITDIKYGLNEVMESKPRSFSRVDVAGEYFGFIAQELQNILPEAISGDSERQLGVDYGSLVAVAFKAIQELKFENDSLKSRIEALEAA